MAGDKTVAVDQSGMQQILQLLGGGKTKETHTSTGDTAALDAVLAQLMGQNSGATIESLMQQFAGKIPQVQAGMAASGGRMPAGQMNPQMQKLLSQMTLAAQAQLQQQELQKLHVAAQAAGTKAQVNRTQTSTTQQQGGLGQKLGQIAALNKMGGNLLGFDPINEGAKKLKTLLGIGGPATDSAGLTVGGTPAAPMSLDQSMDFFNGGSAGGPDLGSINFGDFSSGFGGIDQSFNALDGALNLGNFDFGGVGGLDLGLGFSYDPSMGGFGADMALDSFSAGNEAVGSALPSVLSDVSGFLPGLSYLLDPSKIGSAFEIGEGNVAKDLGEIASLGSAVGSIGGALGMGMGGLAGLAPTLGPIGIALMGIAAAFTDEDSDVTAAKELDGLLFGKKDYDNLTKAATLGYDPTAITRALANQPGADPQDILAGMTIFDTPEQAKAKYAQYGATMGKDLEAAALYQKWDGRLNPYRDYLGERGTAYFDQMQDPTKSSYLSYLSADSTQADRDFAYKQDATTAYKQYSADNDGSMKFSLPDAGAYGSKLNLTETQLDKMVNPDRYAFNLSMG